MKHEHWELMIDGKLANRFKDWDIDAQAHASNLSMWAPLLTVELYEGWHSDRKLVSTWRKGKKVKPTMSDTPRTDAAEYKQTDSNPPESLGMVDVDFARQLERELAREKRHTEAVMRTLKDALGIEDGRECLEEIGRLKDELASVTKGSLELEEERDELDREFQDLERKWNDAETRIKQLQHALSLVVPKCDHLHHPNEHQHKITEPCPVEELIRKAQNP